MPATITEAVNSREWSNGKCTLRWTIRGTSNDLTVKGLLWDTRPATYADSLVPESEPAVECVWADTVADDGQWNCELVYFPPDWSQPDPPETGESSFSFDTSGGTQHVTQSRQTISRTAASGTAPDFKGAIGVSHSSVEGVDVTVPVYAFSETHYLSADVVTAQYKGTLMALTGKTNNASFKGLAAGECIFLGAGGSMRAGGDWEISFKFAASPNRTSIVIGDITVPAKKGWEYLWVKYSDQEDTDAKSIVQRPIAAYVEKVYEEGDLSQLGIGT